jgi:hypothetical protein
MTAPARPHQSHQKRPCGWLRWRRQPVVLTRLHVRYTANTFPEDLMFTQTKDRQNWQTRYVVQHPYDRQRGCQCSAKVARNGLRGDVQTPRGASVELRPGLKDRGPRQPREFAPVPRQRPDLALQRDCVAACVPPNKRGIDSAARRYYQSDLPARLAHGEKQTLAQLTGWKLSDIDAMPDGADRYSWHAWPCPAPCTGRPPLVGKCCLTQQQEIACYEYTMVRGLEARLAVSGGAPSGRALVPDSVSGQLPVLGALARDFALTGSQVWLTFGSALATQAAWQWGLGLPGRANGAAILSVLIVQLWHLHSGACRQRLGSPPAGLCRHEQQVPASAGPCCLQEPPAQPRQLGRVCGMGLVAGRLA